MNGKLVTWILGALLSVTSGSVVGYLTVTAKLSALEVAAEQRQALRRDVDRMWIETDRLRTVHHAFEARTAVVEQQLREIEKKLDQIIGYWGVKRTP